MVSLALRWGTWGASVSAIEEQTGQPAVPGRPEHEVVDEQLGAAVEEIGEGLRAVLGLEPVVLLDRDPGQLAPLPGQLVAAAGELLLLLQQLVALRLPLLLRADPVLRHQVPPILRSAGPVHTQSANWLTMRVRNVSS